MIDKLRRSFEGLESPTCPNCHIDMDWFHSVMASPMPLTINHFFSCPNCKRVRETQVVLDRDAETPPAKLSAPVRRFVCAA